MWPLFAAETPASVSPADRRPQPIPFFSRADESEFLKRLLPTVLVQPPPHTCVSQIFPNPLKSFARFHISHHLAALTTRGETIETRAAHTHTPPQSLHTNKHRLLDIVLTSGDHNEVAHAHVVRPFLPSVLQSAGHNTNRFSRGKTAMQLPGSNGNVLL